MSKLSKFKYTKFIDYSDTSLFGVAVGDVLALGWNAYTDPVGSIYIKDHPSLKNYCEEVNIVNDSLTIHKNLENCLPANLPTMGRSITILEFDPDYKLLSTQRIKQGNFKNFIDHYKLIEAKRWSVD